jgi:metallo-beta-lactamase family protein
MRKSQLTFWGGVGAVTGSNFILELSADEKSGASNSSGKIMIDCGMFQGGGPEAYEKNKEKFPYDPASVDVLLVTHAHIDHIGRIPKLVKDGFSGKIFSTRQTKEIAALMFDDAIKIMNDQAKKRGESQTLYTQADATKALSLWETKKYREKFDVSTRESNDSPLHGIQVEFLDAGHILGSASIRLSRAGRNIIFSGDLGNSPSPIVRDAESAKDAHVLVLDSTYGDRTHQSREDAEKKFLDTVSTIIKEKGTLLIPVFSLERAHIVLYQLNNLVEAGTIPAVPVYLDSPLANRLMPIYESSKDIFNDETKERFAGGDNIFDFPKLKVVASNMESDLLGKQPSPKIIIAGSGMSVGGRIPAHEKRLLPNPDTTLLITGYQSAGTLGRALLEGAKSVTIHGEPVEVRAKVKSIEGFSAHRDGDGLLEFVETGAETLEQIFAVHGEPKSCLFLVQRIRDYLGLNAVAPEKGKVYDIGF